MIDSAPQLLLAASTSALGQLDWAIIGVYAVLIVGIGVAAGFWRGKAGDGAQYFLADRSLTWPVIGLAMFAANISTVHLVSLAESAYKFGLVYGNFEWMAGFTLVLLAVFFAPLYLRSQVSTLPDFLERRYNRACRDWLSFISLLSAIVLHIGVALYTAAYVLRGMLAIPIGGTILGIDALMFIVIVLGVVTGLYTLVGGLLAVVWTESVQTLLLLVGAVAVTAIGLYQLGGYSQLATTLAAHPHPLADAPIEAERVTWSTGNFLSMARGPSDPSGTPWFSILLGYPVIGIWYWCCDQTIVQRVLAAKDERHARLGPLFCAVLKILPVFLFVLPGIICVALVQKGAFGGEAPAAARDTYTFLLTHLLPTGLKGLVIAAMLAAAMQTCSAALNSTATLVAYDIVKRWRPATSDTSLVTIGKITTGLATILAIVISPIFGHYDTLFQGINTMIAYVAPPITTVFLLGVFWKRASARAALLTLVVGGALGLTVFALDWYKIFRPDFMLAAFVLMVICFAIQIPASYLFPETLKEEARPLVWESWREPLQGPMSYKVVTVAVCVLFVLLYVIYW
jgi:SSS family solute:Na+ symporter